MELYDPQGRRLYLTAAERRAFLKAARDAPREVRTFCLVLHDTGCRISEALALTPRSVDLSGKAIVFETLKKRRSGVYRALPVPDSSLDILNTAHGLIEAHRSRRKGVADGPHKCPKGLRHGFGVNAISKGVPLNMLSKWMGHASLKVTAIYANALGEEQRNIAARMWEDEEGGQ
jgi:integrase